MAVNEIYRFRHRARLRYFLGVIRRTGVASSDLQRRRLWAPSNVGEFLFPWVKTKYYEATHGNLQATDDIHTNSKTLDGA